MFAHRIHPRYLSGPSEPVVRKLGLRDRFCNIALVILAWLSACAVFVASHKPFKISYLDAEARRSIAKKILERLNYPNPFTVFKFAMKFKK